MLDYPLLQTSSSSEWLAKAPLFLQGNLGSDSFAIVVPPSSSLHTTPAASVASWVTATKMLSLLMIPTPLFGPRSQRTLASSPLCSCRLCRRTMNISVQSISSVPAALARESLRQGSCPLGKHGWVSIFIVFVLVALSRSSTFFTTWCDC